MNEELFITSEAIVRFKSQTLERSKAYIQARLGANSIKAADCYRDRQDKLMAFGKDNGLVVGERRRKFLLGSNG